jgi:ppGpp synthetase/RelA/SpoT-type nucleotidyltranferase
MSFDSKYSELRPRLVDASRHLKEYVDTALREERVLFHSVIFRVKTLRSALRKIKAKNYRRPFEQLMDLVGGRVYTYFRNDSQIVERVIRKHFTVIEAHSSNKQDDLEFNTFGYTSRHLVCEIGSNVQDLRLRSLYPEKVRLEFQIRSVLEDSWAEIEHELVYKARTVPPDSIRRRFAATAAGLEMIEREFADLREFELCLAKQRSTKVDRQLDAPLDRAWLVAILESEYPDRASWNSDPTKDVFYHGKEVLILDALREQQVSTVRGFRKRVRDPKTKRLVARYLRVTGLNSASLSHLPVALFSAFIDGPIGLVDELRDVLDHAALATLEARWARIR